jgi:hypothetical protein
LGYAEFKTLRIVLTLIHNPLPWGISGIKATADIDIEAFQRG